MTAVSDVSFEVPEGSILGVIGPSGSGKTTTIRMLMGSLAPSEGSVSVLGHDPLHFDHATRERIGYMPQQFILYPDLTAGENVDFVASLFGLLFFRRRRRVRQVLQLLDLWDARKRQAKDLSGGMQRRLELACALVHEPRLLILDEPTAGIDPILRRTIWDELHRLRGEGVTCLVTTQYVTEAEECDTVALISEGRLIAYASPADIRRQAYGGDIVEISTEATFDADVLAAMPGVHGIRQTGLRDFRVAVEDAAVAMPELVDAVAAAGGTVAAAREARPSFEEVFAELVERDRREHPVEAADGDGEASRAPSRTDAERAATATEAGLRGSDPAGHVPVEPATEGQGAASAVPTDTADTADTAAEDAALGSRGDREEVA
ncbi:MAG TPA: ABC transporter ATP-binding protein [Candidatus Limnocylindrales bacterium]|nr:ABC transporter ATP-binding protein [Candidatus Limnocylindrales bacterium]